MLTHRALPIPSVDQASEAYANGTYHISNSLISINSVDPVRRVLGVSGLAYANTITPSQIGSTPYSGDGSGMFIPTPIAS
ncbi:Hypothetical protein NTJ_12419 [Nesidiocoris tenuis]|uniref:Uncharacterized protein n=1 Tax=Nesidiocoris tenuis TaxID=355587 RepID=A0ABN7B7G6_9HEMI|nr:Hypothetical protein NTJ_12419 [Nesidiocoris tenuis]